MAPVGRKAEYLWLISQGFFSIVAGAGEKGPASPAEILFPCGPGHVVFAA
jgi:hypothetical protein